MKTILMKVFKERNLVSNLRNSRWVYRYFNLIDGFSKFSFSANRANQHMKMKT